MELTEREIELITLAAFRGMSEQDMAKELSLSVATVRTHITNIRNKLNSPSMRKYWVVDGLKYLFKNKLITIEEFTGA